jgi:CheY-like chemotaxis protein
LVTGRKLLLADDSVTIQKVIDLTFSDEGIEVTTVGNGEQALSKLEELQPDIVLADIFMPGRNGYEVCEHIKRDERFRHIPVLLLVGSFEPFDEAEARRVGADDYLTKPFQSIRQLVSKVTALISGGAKSEDEASTRDLELPEEMAGQQGRGTASSADIHTADTAPLPQELVDKDPAEAVAHLAGHESLDDEMIEARSPAETAAPPEPATASQTRPTAPFSFADLNEATIQASAQDEPEQLQETISDLRPAEMNEDILSTEPQSRYMSNAAAADEALLDLGEIDAPVSTTEADDFILDLQDDPPARSAAEPAGSTWSEPARAATGAAGGASFSEPAPPTNDSTARGLAEEMAPVMPEPAAASAAAAYGMEETIAPESFRAEAPAAMRSASVEEAAPDAFESERVLEPLAGADGFAAATGAATEEALPLEEAPAYAVEPQRVGAEEASAESAAPTGRITLDQLSPEVIDAIARRAVELLSTKVVEEVAWEVVPQLAELLIKRKLEEEKA